MKIIVDEIKYEGTPEEIVGKLRELLFDRPDVTDTESYIRYIQGTYKRAFAQDMILPETKLDGRIRAMFAILEEAELAEVLEYE
ncbi:MAG: hypothetical protein PHO41_08585 [Eubacteriales bacterium]|nr:hypothetical protein [Eubacteriales bacterium]